MRPKKYPKDRKFRSRSKNIEIKSSSALCVCEWIPSELYEGIFAFIFLYAHNNNNELIHVNSNRSDEY